MGPHVETSESAAPALLVLSTQSILVRITLCGVDTPRDGMTANLTRATWGARCGKSARRVLRGGTGTSGLTARLVPTHHNVQHSLLLEKVARRVQDASMMKLLKMILKSTGRKGVPQGGVISPMLSNLYHKYQVTRLWLDMVCMYSYQTATKCCRNLRFRPQFCEGVVLPRSGKTYAPCFQEKNYVFTSLTAIFV